MDPRPRSHVCTFLLRAATLVAAAAIAAGCNMLQSPSAEVTPTEPQGAYGANQQALQGAQSSSNRLTCGDLLTGEWYLCVSHSIEVQFPPYAKGSIWAQATSPNCIRLIASQQGSATGSEIDVPISIGGAVASDEVCCKPSGTAYVSLTASGECLGTAHAGVVTLTITEYWGTARADLQCQCVDPEKDCHADEASGPITIGGLGEMSRSVDFELLKSGTCRPLTIPGNGMISGTLNYCLQDHPSDPFVGLEPLGCP